MKTPINLNKAVKPANKAVITLASPAQSQIQGFCLHKKTDFGGIRVSSLACPAYSKFAVHGDHKGQSWREMGGLHFQDGNTLAVHVKWRTATFVDEKPSHLDRQRHNQSFWGYPTSIFRKHFDPAVRTSQKAWKA